MGDLKKSREVAKSKEKGSAKKRNEIRKKGVKKMIAKKTKESKSHIKRVANNEARDTATSTGTGKEVKSRFEDVDSYDEEVRAV